MAAVTTGINHRWVTSSVCLGGKDHVDHAAASSVSCPCFHSALEGASKSCYIFSKGIFIVRDMWCHHSRAELLSPLTQLDWQAVL